MGGLSLKKVFGPNSKELFKQAEEKEKQIVFGYEAEKKRIDERLKKYGKRKIDFCINEIKEFYSYYSLIENIDIVTTDLVYETFLDTAREMLLKIELLIHKAEKDLKEETTHYTWGIYGKIDDYRKEKNGFETDYNIVPYMLTRRDEAKLRIAYVDRMEKHMLEQIKEWNRISKNVDALENILDKYGELIIVSNKKVKEIVTTTNDWKFYSEEEKSVVVDTIKVVLKVQELIELPLLDSNGNLTERTMDLLEDYMFRR